MEKKDPRSQKSKVLEGGELQPVPKSDPELGDEESGCPGSGGGKSGSPMEASGGAQTESCGKMSGDSQTECLKPSEGPTSPTPCLSYLLTTEDNKRGQPQDVQESKKVPPGWPV